MPKHGDKQKQIDAAVKSGKLTKKQAEKLSTPLLMGIIRRGDKKGGIVQKEKKMGKEKGKPGRPKAGSKVRVVE